MELGDPDRRAAIPILVEALENRRVKPLELLKMGWKGWTARGDDAIAPGRLRADPAHMTGNLQMVTTAGKYIAPFAGNVQVES